MIDRIGTPAIRGIQRGLDGLRRTADDIAGQPVQRSTRSRDMARSMVELQQHQQQVAANTRTLKAAYDMIGSIIDVKA
jgi:hypothetical protein